MLALWLAVTISSADDGAAHIRLYPDRVEVPVVEATLSAEMSTSGLSPRRGGGSIRVRGLDVGPEWHVLRVFGLARFDPFSDEALSAWQVAVTPAWRLSRSQSVPMAADLRMFQVAVGRDAQLGQDLDARAHVLRWTGGLWLPSLDPGDLDAHLVVDFDLLGASVRRYQGILEPFVGAYLGGLGGEIRVGQRLTRAVVFHVDAGGRAGWSLGKSDGLSVLSDADVHLELGVGGHDLGLVVGGAHRFTRDSGHDLDLPRWLAEARLELTP